MRLAYHVFLGLCVTWHYVGLCLLDRPSNFLKYAPLPIVFLSRVLFRRIISSDPGIAPMYDEERHDEQCRHCGRLRRSKTKHCHVCKVCVDGFDHHCDVLDVCIGRGNVVLFRVFLWVHALLCGVAAASHFGVFWDDLRTKSMFRVTLMFSTLACVELSFGFALLTFYLFHCTLCLLGYRTYDVVLTCRRLFEHGPRRRVDDEKTD